MTEALALGIDLGTSGVRSAVLDAGGAVVAMGRAGYGHAPDAQRDPDRWWTAVLDCFDAQMQALREAGHSPDDIATMAVDGTSGSLVLTNAALIPVTRALMYNDGGFGPEAERIAAAGPSPHVAQGPASALSRALRLASEDRAQSGGGRAVHLCHQADYITARLTGRGGHTDVNNALKTGIDPETGRWPAWIVSLAELAPLLPVGHAPGAPLAPLAPEIARRFGLSSRAIVHAGTTDSVAAFLAATDPVPGAAVTSLGTTLAIKLFSQTRIDAPEIGLYAHRLAGGWLLGGASNTGGGVLRRFFDLDEITALSAKIDPAAESAMDYYPLPRAGERFPINDPDLPPRVTPRPPDDAAFLHGLLESMARIERRGYEVLAERGAPWPETVVTAGGGAANAAWSAIRARVLGRPVVMADTPEAAVGVARLTRMVEAVPST